MKVLQVIPAVAPRYGGPTEAVLGMCGALRQAGEDVLIATTDADGRGRLPVEHGRVLPHRGIPTIFLPRQLSESFKYSRPLARWLNRHVDQFDVVHIHAVFSHSSIAAAAACRQRAVPYVVRAIGSLSSWGLNQKQLRKRLIWHFGVRQMLRSAAAIHYTSAGERRSAEQALGLDGGAVVPLGVDQALLSQSAAAGRSNTVRSAPGAAGRYVLFLGRLHQAKRLEILLDAFLDATSAETLSHWRLILAGAGDVDYVATLQQQVEARWATERIQFVGWLSGSEKLDALAGAALLAAPSFHENFGLSIVEALACGVPVLVTPEVNLAEEIAAARVGWVVPGERAELSRALAEILLEDDERAIRGAAGRDLVSKRFTWDAVADQLVTLYRAVASKAS